MSSGDDANMEKNWGLIPGTVGNYRMGDLSDDMVLTAFGTGVLTTPIAMVPACAGSGGLAAAKSAPNAYYATMAAAGTPMGQTWINTAQGMINGLWGNPGQPTTATEAGASLYSLYGTRKSLP